MNTKKILVTGASGFVAGYLIPALLKSNPKARVLGISRHLPRELKSSKRLRLKRADLVQFNPLKNIIQDFKPQEVYHLAGMSSVADSFKDPSQIFHVNVEGTINLFEALAGLKLKPKVLLVSSGQIYGKTFRKKISPGETDPAEPLSPYALSKLMMEEVGKCYFVDYHIPVFIVRSFNHTGPGQDSQFSVANFVRQFARMKPGKISNLSVGNVEVLRDFSDVRDIVEGYKEIVKKGKAGEVYNLGSGLALPLRKIIKQLVKLSGCRVKIVSNLKRRPLDIKVMRADIRKIQREIGWRPHYSFQQTLKDLYRYSCQQI
jgi:GDP-4-dehydro-6-deoxy-D-mannose reductase